MKAYATKMAKSHEIERKWYVIDAEDLVLGRLATKVATVLRGKDKPFYTPHVDCGDFVIIVNADKVKLTGKKLDQKVYQTYSGHPGGRKETTYRKLMAEKPELAVYHAVRGMVPHNKLGDAVMKKLRVYAGPDHPHVAQKPETMTL